MEPLVGFEVALLQEKKVSAGKKKQKTKFEVGKFDRVYYL